MTTIPTVRFLAGDVAYNRIETNAALPLAHKSDNGMLLILDTDRRELFEEAKRIYPSGEFTEVRPPFGGPVVLYTALLDADVLASVEGLTATYRDGAGAVVKRKDGALNFTWPDDSPVSLPFQVEWEGALDVDTYGPYRFYLEAPGQAELRIGEQVVLSGDGSAGPLVGGLRLARGIHRIRVTATGGHGTLRLSWQPPDGPATVLPKWALFVPPVSSNGLLGRYYANGDWSGEPALAQIDPKLDMYFHVPVLPRPYTVEWTGKIAIPVAGRYAFGLRSTDESMLWIDDAEVAASDAQQSAGNSLGRGLVDLDAGLHDIRVRFADRTDHTNIHLYWQTPGVAGSDAFKAVPSELLFPPQAGYPEVDVDQLVRYMEVSAQADNLDSADWTDPATVQVIVDGLAAPRVVAVSGDTVYVAESETGRVLSVDSATGQSTPVTGLPELIEPADLAVNADGTLFVLDAGTGILWRLDAGQAAAVPADHVMRARGHRRRQE